MDNYLNSSDSYMQRMNKTANSKFKVVEPFLGKGINILDFGSGVSSEFISEVVSIGANYYAYDISLIVQTELSRMGVSVLTESDLLEEEDKKETTEAKQDKSSKDNKSPKDDKDKKSKDSKSKANV